MKSFSQFYLTGVFLFCLFLLACMPDEAGPSPDPEPIDTLATNPPPIHFLALGDSYTIGEAVSEPKRWPVQLRDSLLAQGINMESPRIIARTGWTTDELMRAVDGTSDLRDTFELVSLLIGVNNQYRGYDTVRYEREFPRLLQKALDFAGGDTSRVIVLSIPDYGATPFGNGADREKISRELDWYNAYAQEQAEENGVTFFDITPISREARDKPDLVARDGLHPSGLMYTRWVELIRGDVQQLLEE